MFGVVLVIAGQSCVRWCVCLRTLGSNVVMKRGCALQTTTNDTWVPMGALVPWVLAMVPWVPCVMHALFMNIVQVSFSTHTPVSVVLASQANFPKGWTCGQ